MIIMMLIILVKQLKNILYIFACSIFHYWSFNFRGTKIRERNSPPDEQSVGRTVLGTNSSLDEQSSGRMVLWTNGMNSPWYEQSGTDSLGT